MGAYKGGSGMTDKDLRVIDQQWLDERCYSEPADLEPELNTLADEAGALASFEDHLIETIKAKYRTLELLPEIICRLEMQQRRVSRELTDALERHDRLAEAHKFLTTKQPAEVESGPQFPYQCNECDGEFMGGRGAMPGDICPVCSFGRVVNAEVEA